MATQPRMVLISSPDNVPGEAILVHRMLQEGLDFVHLRKPGWSMEAIEAWVRVIPTGLRNRISLHTTLPVLADGLPAWIRELGLGGIHERASSRQEHSSAVRAAWVEQARQEGLRRSAALHAGDPPSWVEGWDYALLSPVFDSLSKPELLGQGAALLEPYRDRPCPLLALGGVNAERIPEALAAGFDGVALLGAIWNTGNPLSAWRQVLKSWELALAGSPGPIL